MVAIFLCLLFLTTGAMPALATPVTQPVSAEEEGGLLARLVGRITAPVREVQELMPLAGVALRNVVNLPDLLGYTESQAYLVLVQNDHELRPTGGFISAAGRITLEEGRLVDFEVVDSYRVFKRGNSYPSAPPPMQQYMNIDLLVFRDANWSPDLPTSAQLLEALYLQDMGVPISGVVTVDLHAAELLIDALGPLTLDGVDEPITGATFVEQIKQFWDQPIGTDVSLQEDGLNAWWGQRKDFMPLLVDAALARLGSDDVSYLAVLRAGMTALDQRAIQVWLNNPAANEAFADLGWDGSIRPVAGEDFVALVDTNMGFNKVDAVMDRSLDYRVSWPDGAGAPALAELTVTYTHTLPVPGHVCDWTPRYGENYDDMTERCYYNYVRLYTPAGSELISMDGVDADSVGSRRGENGTQVFAGYFIMEPGTEHQVTFRYRLPDTLQPDGYGLAVQRQAGAGPLALTAQVGARAPQSTTLETGWWEWDPAGE